MEVSQESQVNGEVEGEICSNFIRKTEHLYLVHEKQFVRIFPEEVWVVILGQLKDDPDGQTNCANASPYFWEILKNDRVLFLFPKVIEVMAPRIEVEEDKDADSNQDKYDWRASVLECRLVCSAWNKAVEHCYESYTMAGLPELSEGNLDPRSAVKRMGTPWTRFMISVGSLDDIQDFLRQFKESHLSGIRVPPKSPFFGRWFTVDGDNGYEEDDLKNGITGLLELWGKYIWYFSVSFTDSLPFSTQRMGINATCDLANWLGLMPNLKFLNLRGPKIVTGLTRNDFQVNPIPKLEKLEMLEFDMTNELFVSEVLRVNNHVKALKMKNICGITEIRSRVSLRMDHERGRVLSANLRQILRLPVQQLRMLYLEHASKYFLTIERNWWNTLTELDLKDPFGRDKATILRESKELRLRLPGIRRLSLRITGLFYLDFIWPMNGSLEHLEILESKFKICPDKAVRETVKNEQIFELVGFEERMQESNIWKLFPKLETVTFGIDSIFPRNETKFVTFSRDGVKE